MKKKDLILIVEDAPELAQLLDDYLKNSDFATHCIGDGNLVVDWVKINHPKLVLLDLMLPGKDGMLICQELRSISDLPIIIITAKVEEQDRLMGLELGADDYICKPFSPREVVARVKAVLRRTTAVEEPRLVELDESKYQAKIKGKPLTLTVVEFHLLAFLANHPGQVFSRSQLIERIYSDSRVVSDRTIDSHVKKLRKKINQIHEGELLHSVYSAGYKFEESSD